MKEKEKNYLKKFAKECTLPIFDRELYAKYDVKRGLRDINGKGVVAGLTNISEIKASEIVDGKSVPAEGELYYRGYPIEELVGGCLKDGRFGFEEVTYLLLTGKLPTAKELDEFRKYLTSFYTLPKNFVRDIIMKSPSEDMMNTLIRSVLALFPYDAKANDTSIENVVRQCVMLTAVLPIFTVYSYAACNFYKKGESLIIHRPRTDLSTAENILYMLRPDCSYTELEARVLDLALILHAEHGGGNNSTFTTHVVTSSGTDTYSAVAAALCSLKGPKHGGANIKVVRMIKDMEKNINITNDDEVRKYLEDLVDGKAFDRAGLIYGMGHAVYSISDPRAKIFKNFVQKLAKAKHRDKTFALYDKIERLAPEVIAEKRHIYKGVSANVDFYSGFVYDMLNIPTELYTPIFAVARIAGWSAHRIEELTNEGKIIRPAYKSVGEHRQYVPMKNR
ncbi:MAG: citrate/2-methylcitrate synthase [Clostridiales bacterium]|nr:citrate/2-methylcitrate synthase [Clostridiales bacterium]MDD6341648.1 citrate/2-methylcitrate synthase [Eubacteriales bacterium]MDD7393397.1 citrate/2-methylcitrate synthase [Eubacteriales bacterium]